MRTLFSGRLNRWNFFLGGLLLFIFAVIVSFFSYLLSHSSSLGTRLPISFYILIPVSLFFSVSLGIRRFHDFNLSGWWVLPYIFIPVASTVLLIHGGLAVLRTDSGFFTFLMKIELIFDIFLFFYPGTRAQNRYGMPPTNKPLMWRALFPKAATGIKRNATPIQIERDESMTETDPKQARIEVYRTKQEDTGPSEPIAPLSL